MEEGNVFFAARVESPWPPADQRCLWKVEQQGCVLSVAVFPDGHLHFRVSAAEGEIASYCTQPVRVQGNGFFLVSIAWSASQTSVYLNGKQLEAFEHSPSEPVVIVTKDWVGGDSPSYEHPDASEHCGEWVRWRKHRYANPKMHAKKDRRLKSEEEQIAELREALRSLDGLVNAVQSGSSHYVPFIAAALRALIYWDTGYNPLLLRIAGRLGLPLPVFASTTRDLPAIIQSASYHYVGPATLTRIALGQRLMDLQEWLESEIQFERFAAKNADELPKTREMSTKELILLAASTLGVAHYDDDIPLAVDRLRHLEAFEHQELSRFLLSTAGIISGLGRYILDAVDRTGEDKA